MHFRVKLKQVLYNLEFILSEFFRLNRYESVEIRRLLVHYGAIMSSTELALNTKTKETDQILMLMTNAIPVLLDFLMACLNLVYQSRKFKKHETK